MMQELKEELKKLLQKPIGLDLLNEVSEELMHENSSNPKMAEGYFKAGLPGEITDVYKISRDNGLTGEDIKKLFFGKGVKGVTLVTKKPWQIERDKEGHATILDSGKSDSGRSWVEDDMLCDQWNSLYEGLKDCWVIYRNPDGSRENFDTYLGVPGYGIFPFSEAD